MSGTVAGRHVAASRSVAHGCPTVPMSASADAVTDTPPIIRNQYLTSGVRATSPPGNQQESTKPGGFCASGENRQPGKWTGWLVNRAVMLLRTAATVELAKRIWRTRRSSVPTDGARIRTRSV